MTDNYATVAGPDFFVNVVARAVLRKWPSLNNQRRMDATTSIPCFARGATAKDSTSPTSRQTGFMTLPVTSFTTSKVKRFTRPQVS